jgi:hypothetical protein
VTITKEVHDKMMDYRKILMLRSMGLSQREMERNKIASRETTKEIFDVADRLGVHWPLEDDVTNNDLERLLFPDKYKNVCMYVEPDYHGFCACVPAGG